MSLHLRLLTSLRHPHPHHLIPPRHPPIRHHRCPVPPHLHLPSLMVAEVNQAMMMKLMHYSQAFSQVMTPNRHLHHPPPRHRHHLPIPFLHL